MSEKLKMVVTLNLEAFLNFSAWQHFFHCFSNLNLQEFAKK
jgi:hypothetical protein